jgi:hypothetical protein
MGGMGLSGVGRTHGPEGLLKYTESQTIATGGLRDHLSARVNHLSCIFFDHF